MSLKISISDLPTESDVTDQHVMVIEDSASTKKVSVKDFQEKYLFRKQTPAPPLTAQQKSRMQSLMTDYFNIRDRFIYNDESNNRNTLASDDVLNTAAHEAGQQVYRLNCSNFVQLIMMGRSAADFPVSGNYSPAITKAFDFGYYAQFPFRRSAGGLFLPPDEAAGREQMEYFGFRAPHGANDDRESYSWNSYYTGNTENLHGQTYRSYMISADLAFELYSLGCEIPLAEVDVGDIVFFKPQGDGTNENENFRRNKIAWRNITHCAMIYDMSEWPAPDQADAVVDQTVRRIPDFIECVSGTPIKICGINKRTSYDKTRHANLMYNAVMAARLPIAWGIPSNVPNAITKLQSAYEREG